MLVWVVAAGLKWQNMSIRVENLKDSVIILNFFQFIYSFMLIFIIFRAEYFYLKETSL